MPPAECLYCTGVTWNFRWLMACAPGQYSTVQEAAPRAVVTLYRAKGPLAGPCSRMCKRHSKLGRGGQH